VAFFTVKVRGLTVLDGPQRSVNSAITDAAKEPGSVGTDDPVLRDCPAASAALRRGSRPSTHHRGTAGLDGPAASAVARAHR
jgi:hypothetical protein